MRALSVPGETGGEAGPAEAPQQGSVPLRAQAAFPKAARLLKTDEFSSVFRLRPWRRTAHFVVYGRPTGNDARLGLVIGKKYAPRAATRHLVRRLARVIRAGRVKTAPVAEHWAHGKLVKTQ